ncbi:hypothetical protein AM10699_61800 (plasmid) [Acaryochloris marina MBIC10699]|nr:hypothetical protein AM10699_61800 [Acaryochloris marina MBIC10699]
MRGGILISVHQQEGVGRARIQALHPIAEISNCCRIWLVTPNNNLVGQTFYKAVGFQKVAVYPGAVARSRKLKPDIPMFDEQGVAINDEIDFELRLSRD